MQTIRVADITINVESGDKEFFDRRYKDYLCPKSDNPDMVLKTVISEEIGEPEGELILQTGASYIIKAENGNFIRYVKSAKGYIPYKFTYTEDYSFVTIEICRDAKLKTLNSTDLEYLFTGFMFANRLSVLGGTVLHSSAMAYKDCGIVFSADPGTGKSTHVSLWKNKFGDDVTIINDDKPAIRITDNKAYIYGTPWSGKTELNINIKKPLKAIVFIERSSENTISKTDIANSVLNLSRQLPNPFYDEDIGIKTIRIINRLFEIGVPVYTLKCSISEDAVKAVYEEIIGGKFS